MNQFLVLFWVVALASCNIQAKEKNYQIELSDVQERFLYGGLGSSKEPLSSITEFFVPELAAPLISIAGEHADVFKNKKIYIFIHDNYAICPTNSYSKNCFACPDCKLPENLKNLKRFDNAEVENIRKKLIKSLSYSSLTVQKENNIIEFQFPIKGAHPLSLASKHTPLGPNVEPAAQFRSKNIISIFKSADDVNYYVCPQSDFSQSCYICIDCSEKLEKIKTYLPPK